MSVYIIAGGTTLTQPIIHRRTDRLTDQYIEEFKDAMLLKCVTMKFQCQELLLEEAKRDLAETRRNLEAYKEAFAVAERHRHDLEQEKRALKDEILELKERGMHGREERFEQEQRALNDGILQLKAIVTCEKRVAYQQNPLPVSADTERYAKVCEGSKVA